MNRKENRIYFQTFDFKYCVSTAISYAAFGCIIPRSTRSGTSTANQGPSPNENACAIPNFGTFRAHNGLKWSDRQIRPPLKYREIKKEKKQNHISFAPNQIMAVFKLVMSNDLDCKQQVSNTRMKTIHYSYSSQPETKIVFNNTTIISLKQNISYLGDF